MKLETPAPWPCRQEGTWYQEGTRQRKLLENAADTPRENGSSGSSPPRRLCGRDEREVCGPHWTRGGTGGAQAM